MVEAFKEKWEGVRLALEVGDYDSLDILADKKELYNWLASIGFVKQRKLVRMYLKNNPFPGDIEKQYLICGPEFG